MSLCAGIDVHPTPFNGRKKIGNLRLDDGKICDYKKGKAPAVRRERKRDYAGALDDY
jgi:hypothetical protein